MGDPEILADSENENLDLGGNFFEEPEEPPTKSNPVPTDLLTTADRLDRLESTLGDLTESLGVLLETKIKEAKTKANAAAAPGIPTVANPAADPGDLNFVALGQFTTIQNRMMKPVLEALKSGIQMGKQLGENTAAYDNAIDNNDMLIAQLEEAQAVIKSGQAGQKVDFKKISETITEVMDAIVPRKAG